MATKNEELATGAPWTLQYRRKHKSQFCDNSSDRVYVEVNLCVTLWSDPLVEVTQCRNVIERGRVAET